MNYFGYMFSLKKNREQKNEKRVGMKSIIQEKASTIYKQFSKAPILEMVQYMVDQNVYAQVLHQLKLIDQKCHKNAHVISYGEKVYAAYERVCKILVTYPHLEFKNHEFVIAKDKDAEFQFEYMHDSELDQKHIKSILSILNQCLYYGIESVHDDLFILKDHLADLKNLNQLVTFLEEACGENYKKYIQKYLKSILSY